MSDTARELAKEYLASKFKAMHADAFADAVEYFLAGWNACEQQREAKRVTPGTRIARAQKAKDKLERIAREAGLPITDVRSRETRTHDL